MRIIRDQFRWFIPHIIPLGSAINLCSRDDKKMAAVTKMMMVTIIDIMIAIMVRVMAMMKTIKIMKSELTTYLTDTVVNGLKKVIDAFE